MSKKKLSEKEFVAAASPECVNCKNFGEAACPATQAFLAQGADAEVLKEEISVAQAGQDLHGCTND